MKILVTGGAGFIGGHLAASLLAAGAEVDVLDNFARGVEDRFLRDLGQRGARCLERDLSCLEPDALGHDYDYIYHLAAIVGVRHVLQRPYDVLWQNAALTQRAISVARAQRRLRRLVFASTSEVYAGTLAAGQLAIPTPEDSALVVPSLGEPRTSYMLSKIYGEAMCRASGVPITIIRPHNVYGPRMGLSHVIPELLQRAYRAADGDALDVASIDHRRTFCYVDDAVSQIRGVAEAEPSAGQVVNIGSTGPEVTIGELARLVVETVGRSLHIRALPVTPGSPPRRAPDTRLADAWSGHHARVPLAEGIRRTFTWYKENVFQKDGITAI